MNEIAQELRVVGDALEHAWRQDVSARRLPRRRIMIGVLAAAMLLGAGAAIGSGVLKSEEEQAEGLLGGYRLFENSTPTCTSISVTSYRCILDRVPTGMTFFDEDRQPVYNKFLGLKVATVDATLHIDGACVAVSADGRRWDCYLGEEAVRRGLLRRNLLGTYMPNPPTA